MYWAGDQSHSFVSELMSRDRFKQLNGAFCLHQTDHGLIDDDPATHINDFVEHFNKTAPTLDVAEQYLVFDEAMCAYTGRSAIKQYLPAKPHPYGFKFWCLGSRRYIRRIKLFEGASEEISEDGKMCDLVNEMTEGYEGKSHILYCDNYFTSINLLNRLRHKQIFICGSVNINRLKLSTDSPLKQSFNQNLARHEHRHFQCDDMQVVVWRDNKVIKLLYNHLNPFAAATTCKRYNEQHEEIDVPVPLALWEYFYRARGIDIIDQLMNSYMLGRKSMNQRTRLIWWLMSLCMVNAYQLFVRSHSSVTQLDFRLELMKSLAAQHHHTQHPPLIKPVDTLDIWLAHKHYSELGVAKRDCVVCSVRLRKRVRTKYFCVGCMKAMCIGKCFYTHHACHNNQILES
jgi:hypothetical protein